MVKVKKVTRFDLYSCDVRDLVDHITTRDPNATGETGRVRYEPASFDIDEDGYISISVEGKGKIVL